MALIDGVVYRGADATITLTITNANGSTRNITSDSLTFIVKYRVKDTTPLVTKTVGAGITKTNAAGGIATVALADTDFGSIAQSTTLAAALKITDSSNIDTIIPFDLSLVVTAGG